MPSSEKKLFYVHFEDNLSADGSKVDIQPFTKRFSISDDNVPFAVDDLLDSFCQDFHSSNNNVKLLRNSLTFHCVTGRKVSNSRKVYGAVDHLQDYYVRGVVERLHQELKPASLGDELVNDSLAEIQNRITDIKKKVKELISNKSFRQARLISEVALKDLQNNSSTQPSRDVVFFFETLAKIQLEKKNGSAAAAYARKGLDIAAKKSYSTIDLYLLLTRAYMEEKEYDEAFSVISSVLLKVGSGSSLLEPLALKAEILFELGRVSEAGDTINRCITPPLAPAEGGIIGNVPVLTAYAYISMSCQQPLFEQPLSALLRALSIQADNKKVRFLLAKLLNTGYSADVSRKDPEDGRGLKELFRQLSARERSTAPAFALLAAVCKDHSAMRPCIRLLETAMNLQPDNASYALNLVHAHEIVGDFEAALSVLANFCERNPTLSLKVPVEINHSVSSSAATSVETETRPLELDAPEMSCEELWGALEAKDSASSDSFYEFRWADDCTHLFLHSVSDSTSAAAAAPTPLIADSVGVSFVRAFADHELDLLALGFTAAKILFLQGKLSLLPGLFRILEPLRRCSKQQLHLTLIRNEHAYFQSIGQILAHRSARFLEQQQALQLSGPVPGLQTLPRPLSDVSVNRQEALFVLGDSHCLSSAWSSIAIAGSKRLIVPKLVTGVKQWHLRPEGDFYPKANFQCAVDSIPNGSEVVLLLGEIDCREGMLLAVERDKYQSVEEAMRTTLQLFMQVLVALVKRKNFKVYIHPVPSVLKETRHLVLAYNILYERAIKALPRAQGSRIKWLGFFAELMKPSTTLSACLSPSDASVPLSLGSQLGEDVQLRDEFALDGTHLSPAYVGLLGRAIETEGP